MSKTPITHISAIGIIFNASDPRQILMEIVREGRESGEFERKTPLDETVHAIYLVMLPFANPLLLQYNLDMIEEAPAQLSNLVLRSLAP